MFFESYPAGYHMGAICDHPFPPHLHELVEIICLTEGKLDMRIGDTLHQLHPGDIGISFPYIPHSYESVSLDAKGLSLIFYPSCISEFESLFLQYYPETPFLSLPEPNQEIKRLIEQMILSDREDKKHLKLGFMHLFLCHLFPHLSLKPVQESAHRSLYYQILHYISSHYTEPLSLESTAKALGISAIHLSHIFSQRLHINFRQYINSLRINYACQLLRDPQYSISQVSYLCGFGNPRTFHRAFLTHCNMPPKEYRKQFYSFPEQDEGES